MIHHLTLLLMACTSPKAPDMDSSPSGGGNGATSLAEFDAGGPFAPQADESHGLVNTSADLEELLEHGALNNACDLWRADPQNQGKKLLCGKSMFFYETFGSMGTPAALTDLLLESFRDEVGPAFSTYGLTPDPFSDKGYPLGMVAGEHGVAFSCASCHFGRLPDGRYAVGAANHQLDYGGLNLAIAIMPLAVMSDLTGAELHPDALAEVQPLLDHLDSDPALKLSFYMALLSLITEDIPEFSTENQGYYAAWLTGTMDFMIQPLPVDDEVHTVSKISPLWGIPRKKEADAAGMAHAMLGWTGNTTTLGNFVYLFDALGGGDGPNWREEELEPLVEYIYSLRAPTTPVQDEAAALRGGRLFYKVGCIDCHAGPRGSGTKLYSYEEIGTDKAMAAWCDANLDGVDCTDGMMPEDPVTHGLKSPRLNGLWASTRFLHNGAVGSLQELLCLEGERVPVTTEAMGNQGHRYGCDELSADQKRDIIAWLSAH